MRRTIQAIIVVFSFVHSSFGQLTTDGRKVSGNIPMRVVSNKMMRTVQNPTACTSDTSMFPAYGTTAYNTVSVKTGSSLGQFFSTPQSITISGFKFFAFSLTTTPARPVYIRLRCNVYKAGADSLPSGPPLASDTITVDTVMGATIYLSRIARNAVFKKPVTISSGGYIVDVECDSSSVGAAVITNSWSKGDGKKKNLGCGSVSSKWYRCLQLNIGGVTFDSDMQMYPFVKYNFGTDFTIDNNCYGSTDTVKFSNTQKNNVSGYVYYNYYIYYNLPQYSHYWTYDGVYSQYAVNGFYKPPVKKNFKAQLISTVYSYTSGQCRDTVIKTVYFKPSIPILKSSTNACRGDTVNMTVVSDAGAIIKWFKKASDTTPFNTGNTYKILNIQKNDTFYIMAENGSCKSLLQKVEMTVNDYPNKPTVTNDSICIGAVANLGAKSNLGFIQWYGAPTGGGLMFTGNTLQTSTLTKDTLFYVQANNNGCVNKGGRVKVQAYVNNSFAPSKPTVVADTFTCFHPTKSFGLTASQAGTDTIRWFNQPTGGSPFAKGSNYSFTPASRGDVKFYVETWNGICGSGRAEIAVHVYDYSQIFAPTGDTICKGDSAYPHLSVQWGTVNWFALKTDLNPVFSGKKPVFGGLNSDTYYYLQAEENGCKNAKWDSIKIFVNSAPVPSLVKADPVCSKGIGTMQVQVPSGKVMWFYDPADLTPFYTGTNITSGILLSNLTYYYQTENKGCTSLKTPITITIKPRPTAGFTWSLVWQNKLICTPITTTNLTLTWDWGDGKTSSGSPYTHTYATKGNYMVRQVATSTLNGCKDTADIPVIVDHGSRLNINKNEISVYPVPLHTNSQLNFTGFNTNGAIVSFYSTDGRICLQAEIKDNMVLLPADLKSGIYIIRINSVGGIYTSRISVAD